MLLKNKSLPWGLIAIILMIVLALIGNSIAIAEGEDDHVTLPENVENVMFDANVRWTGLTDWPEKALAPAACPAGPGAPHTSTVERANFCVFYDPGTSTAAEATTAADHTENKYWPGLTAELGLAPKASGKLEIHLLNTASCNGGTGWSINYMTTYDGCITPDILFQKVLGHELTHRVQYAHDNAVGAPHQTKTFKEGTARAIEDQFDPQDTWVGALGVSSYASQSNTAFNTPDTNWWAYGWRYNFAPAWKYFSEQYPGGTTTEPGYGWDWYDALFDCTTNNIGIAAVNCAQSAMGGPSYYTMWAKFARVLYTRDLDPLSVPNSEYYYIDEQQAGDKAGSVSKNTKSAITSVTSQSWNGESISHDGMDYYEVPIDSSCVAPTVSFTNVTGNPSLWVIGRSGNQYRFDTGGTAGSGSWSQSFLRNDETHLAAIVVGLSADVTADVEMSCGTPVLDIKQPVQLAPDYVQPLDVVVAQVLVTNGSPTSPIIAGFSYTDFTAEIGGAPALILGGGFVEEQYYLLVQAPNISNGPKDFTISLGAASDTEVEAVIYDLTNTDYSIVIDRSGSMGWYSSPPIYAAQAAANFFIDASNSSEGLGVVAYNHDLNPTPLGIQFGTLPHKTNAHNFVNALSATGGTSIGDGLGAPGPNGGAVDQINSSATGNARCQIILLSDGQENTSLFWADVQAAVVGTGCPVMSIAFGPGADETLMQTIASATGGLSFYNDVFVSANRAGATAEEMHLDLGDTYLYTQEQGEGRDRLLAETGQASNPGEVHTRTLTVDETMTNLLVTLDWAMLPNLINKLPGNSHPLLQGYPLQFELRLVAPGGTTMGPDNYEFADAQDGHIGIKVDNPETGDWQLVVERLYKGSMMYEVAASGESQLSVELILLDQLKLDQTTGQEVPIRALLPVGLGALQKMAATGPITVEAMVIAPDGTKTIVPLYDDGQHNQYDQDANDGLWAGVYTLVTQAEQVDQVGEDNYPPPAPAKDQGAYRVVLVVHGAGFSREAKGAFAVEEGESTISPGVPDIYFQQYGAPNDDPDLDSLQTSDEYFAGTSPLRSDSDSDDGVLRESDWSEVQNGLDPLDKADDTILAPESCAVLGQNGVVVIEYDVKPEYDQVRAFRRPEGGAWNFQTNLPVDTGGVYTDTLNVTNGLAYEYQINAVDGTHVSAQVLCGIATPDGNWRPPTALMMLDDGVSTPDLNVDLTFYPYEGEEGILDYDEIVEMRLSNTAALSLSTWEPFTATGKTWQLDNSTPAHSIATVYAEFRNVDGLISDGPTLGSIRYAPVVTLTGVAISGPTTGITGTTYNYAASTLPVSATIPISYTWSPEPNTGQGSNSVSYSWLVTGTQNLIVTASNSVNTITDTHPVVIFEVAARIYLPLVLK